MSEDIQWILLKGSAYQRGLQQASRCWGLVPKARAAIDGRLESIAAALKQPAVANFLARQFEFLQAQDPEGFQESLGIADGLSLPQNTVLTYLHANVVQDMVEPGAPMRDGCTSWAKRQADKGCLVVKNRDYRGEHGVLQQVFLHVDDSLPGGCMVCVGSLGSPGAFSSGMNAQGLAVVDTQIGTRDHGVGWLRYFLMTALLRQCETVGAALSFVASVPHAGGGTLVLGDAQGNCASVELGHALASQAVRSDQFVARTNHYLEPALAAAMTAKADDLSLSSAARLRQVDAFVGRNGPKLGLSQAKALMATHEAGGAICSHAHGLDSKRSRTLSSVIYDTGEKTLHMANGNPCEAPWRRMSLPAPAMAITTGTPK